MTKAKHTPGPWSYEMRHDTNYAHITCDIRGGDNLRGYCGEANARLIAASPELLEALQNMLGIVEDSSGVYGYHLNGELSEWDEFADEINSARTAIAKALGEKLP